MVMRVELKATRPRRFMEIAASEVAKKKVGVGERKIGARSEKEPFRACIFFCRKMHLRCGNYAHLAFYVHL